MVIEAIEKSQKGQGLNGSEKMNCYDWYGINMGDSMILRFHVRPLVQRAGSPLEPMWFR